MHEMLTTSAIKESIATAVQEEAQAHTRRVAFD